jgi:hypothetical protein
MKLPMSNPAPTDTPALRASSADTITEAINQPEKDTRNHALTRDDTTRPQTEHAAETNHPPTSRQFRYRKPDTTLT